MYLAVAQLLVVERHLLGRFAGFLLNTGDRLALLLVLDDLLLQDLGRFGVLVQVIVQVLGQKIDDEIAQRNPGSISFEPSLILVCDSNTGSVTRTEMAAMIDVRMSEGS